LVVKAKWPVIAMPFGLPGTGMVLVMAFELKSMTDTEFAARFAT
jgi:hypothetical protein